MEQPEKSVLKSAGLAHLRELIATTRLLSETIANAIQVRIVLDTNAILRDLIWLSKRRPNAEARTSIQELIVSQTLIPYAPTAARGEVEKHLVTIAAKQRIAIEVIRGVWADYQQTLHFCEVKVEAPNNAEGIRDLNDLPFIQLAREVGASGIATNDKDIAAMGGNAIHFDCIIQLRDYSRAKHTELTFHVGGIVVAAVGIGALAGIARTFQTIIQAIARLPPWVKLVFIAAAVFAIAHPKSREAIVSNLKALGSQIQNGVLHFRKPFTDAVGNFAEAHQRANAALSKARKTISAPKRIPLSTHVYAVCLASSRPLSSAEIERKVLAAGYKTRSKSFKAYLQRTLKEDKRFYSIEGDRWGVVKKYSGHQGRA